MGYIKEGFWGVVLSFLIGEVGRNRGICLFRVVGIVRGKVFR